MVAFFMDAPMLDKTFRVAVVRLAVPRSVARIIPREHHRIIHGICLTWRHNDSAAPGDTSGRYGHHSCHHEHKVGLSADKLSPIFCVATCNSFIEHFWFHLLK